MFEEKNPRDARKMQVGQYGFQGDVVIKKVERIEEFGSMKVKNDGVLAEGEVTGHMHKLFGEFDLRQDKDNNLYFEVKEDVTLKHQEHSPIVIGPGFYKVEIQKEFDHFQERARRVLD